MGQQKMASGNIALEAVRRFLGEARAGDGAETSFSKHLSPFTAARLPPAAQDAWRKIAQLLRASADQAIPEKSTVAMRSWPQARINELIELVHALHAILEKIENDRLEDEVRDSIRHHYL